MVEYNKLDYKDVTLIPRHISQIYSRDEIDISVDFCGRKLAVPIIASPMKDVCDGNFATLMRECGGFGIIHRFNSIEEQVAEFKIGGDCGCAIGINGDYLERFFALYEVGCRVFCIDIANGANKQIETVVDNLLDKDDVWTIAGNVASKEGFDYLSHLWVSFVRLGVSGGSVCTTFNSTGIYHPMVSLLLECNTIHSSRKIADGGIKEPKDMCIALACGANVVMLGSLLCNTIESPGQLIKKDNKFYKLFSGSASFEIQQQYREPRYIEGKTSLLPYTNISLRQLITTFSDGLKSSMSYMNARNLQEYRHNAIIATKTSFSI